MNKIPSGRRAERKEATKRRILEAALELFQVKGFDATTTRAIARKARIAEGTVFNYFPTKDDIALYFFEREVDHAIAAVRNNPKLRRASLDEKLFALVHSQFECLAPYERFIGAAVLHALRPASKLSILSVQSQQLQLRYIAFVEELIDQSKLRGSSDMLGAWGPRVFWLFYMGMVLYWLHDTSEGKQDTLAFLDRSLKLGVGMLKRGRV